MRSLRELFIAPNRKSRFHTERGQLMPLPAWVRLPMNVLLRMLGRTDGGPWIVPSAVGHLEQIMRPHGQVFEFGSGYSTAWYAARSAWVVSLEHDAKWLRDAKQRCQDAGLANCELRRTDLEDFPQAINEFPDEAFDLVVVDGQDTGITDRTHCVAAAATKVRRGGHLLLDDSDNVRYRVVNDVLSGWRVRRFTGMKPFPLVATETSIYQRPL